MQVSFGLSGTAPKTTTFAELDSRPRHASDDRSDEDDNHDSPHTRRLHGITGVQRSQGSNFSFSTQAQTSARTHTRAASGALARSGSNSPSRSPRKGSAHSAGHSMTHASGGHTMTHTVGSHTASGRTAGPAGGGGHSMTHTGGGGHSVTHTGGGGHSVTHAGGGGHSMTHAGGGGDNRVQDSQGSRSAKAQQQQQGLGQTGESDTIGESDTFDHHAPSVAPVRSSRRGSAGGSDESARREGESMSLSQGVGAAKWAAAREELGVRLDVLFDVLLP